MEGKEEQLNQHPYLVSVVDPQLKQDKDQSNTNKDRIPVSLRVQEKTSVTSPFPLLEKSESDSLLLNVVVLIARTLFKRTGDAHEPGKWKQA